MFMEWRPCKGEEAPAPALADTGLSVEVRGRKVSGRVNKH